MLWGGKMSVYKRSRLNKLCSIAAAIVLLVSVLLCIFVCNLFVHIEEMSRTECRLAAEKIINSAVKEAVAFSAVQELITENRDKNGAIQSISLERTGANKLSALISDAVTEKLEQTKSIPIPVGTLSGISFLSGRGFDISLYLSCAGSVTADITSEFVSCGINQSKYRVSIRICVTLCAVLPAGSITIDVAHDFVLGERIIVGSVPQAYFSS